METTLAQDGWSLLPGLPFLWDGRGAKGVWVQVEFHKVMRGSVAAGTVY